MVEIIHNPADQALARRIQADLQAQPATNTTVILLSAPAVADREVLQALERAVDSNRHIVPVITEQVRLPALIEHLAPVDFSQRYDYEALAARLEATPGELHMKVLTPAVRASNQRAAVIVAIGAVVMFLVALYGIGVVGIQAPADEYAAVETEIIETRNAYIDEALPRSTDDALNFEATVEGAAPTLRPLLVATATAAAGE